jgi:membrane protein
MRRWIEAAWDVVKRTFAQWRAHRSAEMAAALAFYGAIALSGAVLIAVYAGAALAGNDVRRQAIGQVARASGSHSAQVLDAILREASNRQNAWVALVIGIVLFALATAGTAYQLQKMLDVVWETRQNTSGSRDSGDNTKRRAGFAAVYFLALLLGVLLFAGAAIHGLTMHTHQLPAMSGILYQALDLAVSIVLLTFIFLCIFAYLPHVDIPWKDVWIASFVSAILYERGQFALVVYLGQMDARSPYADAGALIASLLWLYYSAQVVVVGADLTKALKQAFERQREP